MDADFSFLSSGGEGQKKRKSEGEKAGGLFEESITNLFFSLFEKKERVRHRRLRMREGGELIASKELREKRGKGEDHSLWSAKSVSR